MELIAFLFCKSVRLGGDRRSFDLSVPNFTSMNFNAIGDTPPVPLFSIWSRSLDEGDTQTFDIEVDDSSGRKISGSPGNLARFASKSCFTVVTAPNLTLRFPSFGEYVAYVRFGSRRVSVARIVVGQKETSQPEPMVQN